MSAAWDGGFTSGGIAMLSCSLPERLGHFSSFSHAKILSRNQTSENFLFLNNKYRHTEWRQHPASVTQGHPLHYSGGGTAVGLTGHRE